MASSPRRCKSRLVKGKREFYLLFIYLFIVGYKFSLKCLFMMSSQFSKFSNLCNLYDKTQAI